jgi:hypothetical protein
MRKLLKCLIETLKLESKKDGKSTKQLKYTKDNLKIKESKKKMKYLYRDIKEIIEDTLNRVGLYNEQASTMVFNTGLVESKYRALMQYPSKIARSFFQVEPNTAFDIFDNYLKYRKGLWYDVIEACELDDKYKDEIPTVQDCERLLTINLAFAICMARLVYRRVPAPLPKSDDIESQAEYWLKYYNAGGKGTIGKFIEAVAPDMLAK